jgi:hypothetical protein
MLQSAREVSSEDSGNVLQMPVEWSGTAHDYKASCVRHMERFDIAGSTSNLVFVDFQPQDHFEKTRRQI